MILINEKEISILRIKYKLLFFDSSHRTSMKNMGYCNSETKEIYISKGMSIDITEQTILNEIIHLINMYLTIGLKEDQILQLTKGLYSLII